MTEAEKKERTKKTVKRAWDGGKLILAITALTAAVNGYRDLSAKSVQLSEQNALAFKALSSKVNKMAERMAYMQGRLDGLNESEAEDAVELKIEKFDATERIEDGVRDAKREKEARRSPRPHTAVATDLGDEDGVPDDLVAEVAMMEDSPNQMQVQRHIEIDAFEQLPEDLEELIDVQEQIQEQVQEGY